MDAWETWSEIIVTMVATGVLAGFTWVLARATKQLAQASSQRVWVWCGKRKLLK